MSRFFLLREKFLYFELKKSDESGKNLTLIVKKKGKEISPVITIPKKIKFKCEARIKSAVDTTENMILQIKLLRISLNSVSFIALMFIFCFYYITPILPGAGSASAGTPGKFSLRKSSQIP